jgi:ABC-type branched-subunit amino acid transport system permease subunit
VRPRFLRFVALGVVVQAIPGMISDSTLLTVDLACVYAVGAVGLNVIFGLGGLVSIGQAAVMAVGGYALILLFGKTLGLPLALLIACAGGALTSMAMGFVGARVKTHYFVLASLAFAEVIVLVATNATGLTGGSNGTGLLGTPTIAGLQLTTTPGFFHFGSVVVLVVVYLADALRASRAGLGLSALTMNEYLGLSSGVSPHWSRGLATAVGGVFGGLAGAMLALLDGYLGPQSFSLDAATILLLMVIVAGRAGNGSVVVAALILTFLSQGLLTNPAVGQLAYGIGLIVLVIVAPEGLYGAAEWARKLAVRSRALIADRNRGSA